MADLIATDQTANAHRVNTIRNHLQDRKSITKLVEETYRHELEGYAQSITGRTLNQFEHRLASLLELSDEWLKIVAAKPDGAGRTGAAVKRLRRDFDALGPVARSALERLQATGTTPIACAVNCALGTIESLHGILRREPYAHVAVGRVQALSDDLLFVAGLRLDADGNVDESTPRDVALGLVLDTDSHAETLAVAFDARMAQGDLHGADAICVRMAAEADPAEDGCSERLGYALREERNRTRRELDQLAQMLEQAFIVGEIPDDRRADLNAAIADVSQGLADS